MSLLSLDPANKLLAEVAESRFNWGADVPFCDKDFYNVKLADFDDCSYVVRVPEGTTNLEILVTLPAFKAMKAHGGEAKLTEVFGANYLASDTEADIKLSYDLSTRADLSDSKKADYVKNISLVKNYALGGTFEHFFKGISGSSPAPLRVKIREDTEVFFCPTGAGVTVIYGLSFMDSVDSVVARIFLREFPEQQQKKVARAPPCRFNAAPPRELASAFGITENENVLGYISFAMGPNHVGSPAAISKAATSFVNFRTYLQYHIKCSKSFFHSRMRLRAKSLLQVLNRAEIKDEEKKPKRSVFAGRR